MLGTSEDLYKVLNAAEKATIFIPFATNLPPSHLDTGKGRQDFSLG